MKTIRTVTIALSLLAISAGHTFADPPGLISVQGQLLDDVGSPQNGDFNMVLALYSSPTNSTPLILDSHLNAGTGTVRVDGGIFTVLLGSGVLSDPIGIFTSLNQVFQQHDEVWLEFQVGVPGGAIEPLLPRKQIASVPYAMVAGTASAASITDGNIILPTGSVILASGTFTGDGSGLTGVPTGDLLTGIYTNLYSFTNPGNLYAGDGGAMTNLTAARLTGGIHTNWYDLSNSTNIFAGDGGAMTNLTAAGLLSGIHTNHYEFTSPSNSFFGDGSGLTGIIVTNLNSGIYGGAYIFTNRGNIFAGDGGAMTNLTAARLTGGIHTNWYDLSNSTNIFAGDGGAITNLTAARLTGGIHTNWYDLSNSTNIFAGDGGALTNLTAAELLGGIHSNPFEFTSPSNSFFGDGSGLTGIVATNLNSGIYGGAYIFTNRGNIFAGDGGAMTNMTATRLAGGIHTNWYDLSNSTNLFAGDGGAMTNLTAARLTGGIHTNWYDLSNSTNIFAGDGGALTNLTAAELLGGIHSNPFEFTSPSNTYAGDGSLLDGVIATNLYSGIYAGSYVFTNAGNVFAGDGGAMTNLTAARLDSGIHSNHFEFSNPTNIYYGNGSDLRNLNADHLTLGTVPGNRISGVYTNGISLTNPGNIFFGDGSGLTNVNASSSNATTLNGLDSTQFLRSDTNTTATGSITFTRASSGASVGDGSIFINPATAATNDVLFGVAVAGSDRLTITADGDVTMSGELIVGGDLLVTSGTLSGDGSGLTGVVVSASDATTLDSLDSLQFLRSDIADTFTGPTLIVSTGSLLRVNGELQLNGSLLMDHDGPDGDQSIGFFDDSAIGDENFLWSELGDRFYFSDDVAIEGTLQVGSPTPPDAEAYSQLGNDGIGTPESGAMNDAADLYLQGSLELGGDFFLSDGGDLYMNGSLDPFEDDDQSIFFYGDNNRAQNYLRWDEDTDPYLQDDGIESAFVSAINEPGIQGGWSWDYESGAGGVDSVMCLNRNGLLMTDGPQMAGSGCDLAEMFLGPDGLEPGTLVVLDPETFEGVMPANRANDKTTVGVVSGNAGMVLAGPTADYLPVAQEIADLTRALEAEPENKELETALEELLAARNTWLRGNVPVALVGRVPVKVDGSFGPVERGDRLTTSPTAGHAKVLDQAGPYFGIALESFSGDTGEVLVLLQSGWFGGEAKTVATTTLGRTESEAPFSLFSQSDGNPKQEVMRVDRSGDLYLKGTVRAAAMDLAEYFTLSEPAEPGDVLVADREAPGRYGLGRESADPAVVGVVAAEPGVLLGSGMERIAGTDLALAERFEEARRNGNVTEQTQLWDQLETTFRTSHAPVALSGTVECKVDASFGPIRVGDILTTSPTPGHAMRATGDQPGTIIGKALQGLDEGTGKIRMLVMMR